MLQSSRVLELLVEEPAQQGPDHSDHGQSRHLLPARGERGGDDVGGELESEPGDQPSRVIVIEPALTEIRTFAVYAAACPWLFDPDHTHFVENVRRSQAS